MLLWVLIVTLFGAMAQWFGSNLPPSFKARVLSVQGMIGAAFFLHLFYSHRIRFCALKWRRLMGMISIRCCKIRASPSIRRFSILVMSVFRWRFPLRLPR